jgi:hypothetical protein
MVLTSKVDPRRDERLIVLMTILDATMEHTFALESVMVDSVRFDKESDAVVILDAVNVESSKELAITVDWSRPMVKVEPVRVDVVMVLAFMDESVSDDNPNVLIVTVDPVKEDVCIVLTSRVEPRSEERSMVLVRILDAIIAHIFAVDNVIVEPIKLDT